MYTTYWQHTECLIQPATPVLWTLVNFFAKNSHKKWLWSDFLIKLCRMEWMKVIDFSIKDVVAADKISVNLCSGSLMPSESYNKSKYGFKSPSHSQMSYLAQNCSIHKRSKFLWSHVIFLRKWTQ
jgi:hypothetical protein